MNMEKKEMGLRARTKRAVQAELFAVAMELFLSQGFDDTTVEQIADAAGLSRRSFFRYFASKDDVLTQTLAATGTDIAQELARRPSNEAPWVALRRAFDPLIRQMMADERSLPMTRLMLESPALHASHLQKQASWRMSIADVLTLRLAPEQNDADHRLQADALSAAALACLMSAQAEWVARNGQTALAELLDLTMDAIHS